MDDNELKISDPIESTISSKVRDGSPLAKIVHNYV